MKRVVEELRPIFAGFDPLGVARALFAYSAWLGNIASPVKHRLLATAFLSIPPDEFGAGRLDSYEDFAAFVEQLREVLPSFPQLEDYVPEAEWGAIRFPFEDANHRIFYEGDLSYPCDFLSAFEVLYAPHDEGFRQACGRSPLDEMRASLELQEKVISALDGQPTPSGLNPGDLQAPDEAFWSNVSSFVEGFKADGLGNFGLPLGAMSEYDFEQFREDAFRGPIPSCFFVEINDAQIPMLPRDWNGILFNSWGELFRECYNDVATTPHHTTVIGEVYRYLRVRFEQGVLYPFATLLDEDNQPHSVVFGAIVLAKDKLLLVYLVPPDEDPEEHLETRAPELADAVDCLRESVRFGSGLDGRAVELRPNQTGDLPEPVLLTIISETTTELQGFGIPKDLPGHVAFLSEFLGVVDELQSLEELGALLDWVSDMDSFHLTPLTSFFDKYALFKASHGVLTTGAIAPDFVAVHPMEGSTFRFQSLREFWRIFPRRGFFEHPRSWRIYKDGPGRAQLEARTFRGMAYYQRNGDADVFLNAPFDSMSYEQAQITDLLLQIIDDYFYRYREALGELQLFDLFAQLQILVFPSSLIEGNKQFSHLHHLLGKHIAADMGKPQPGVAGVRVVFDDVDAAQRLLEVSDRSFDLDLLQIILGCIRERISIGVDDVLVHMFSEREAPPRFKLLSRERAVAYPDLIGTWKPAERDFRQVGHRIAKLASDAGLEPGVYEFDEAKERLNVLRRILVEEIDQEVGRFSIEQALPSLLARIDALSHERESAHLVLGAAVGQEVEYDPASRYSIEEHEFLSHHRAFRYLIEKFVQLQPNSEQMLAKEECTYLLALADRILLIYQASDALHYGVGLARLRIDDEFRPSVEQDESVVEQQRIYMQEQAELELATERDTVHPPRTVDEILAEIDVVMTEDFGLSLSGLTKGLAVLADWPMHSKSELSPHYSADREEIVRSFHEAAELGSGEANRIIDFCTLESRLVIRVLDDEDPCDDLPVWEYIKRAHRYNLRPLIRLGDSYFWGPYSAQRAGIIWSGTASEGMLPTDIAGTATRKALRDQEELYEKALVTKTVEVIERTTEYAEREVRLHRRDKEGKHPNGLGDYDALAYFPQPDVVVSGECKDVRQAYCLKDAKRLRDTIFDDHVPKIQRRETYLRENLNRIAGIFGWPITETTQVKSVYISRKSHLWTRFPPIETGISFTTIDRLSDWLDSLIQ